MVVMDRFYCIYVIFFVNFDNVLVILPQQMTLYMVGCSEYKHTYIVQNCMAHLNQWVHRLYEFMCVLGIVCTYIVVIY